MRVFLNKHNSFCENLDFSPKWGLLIFEIFRNNVSSIIYSGFSVLFRFLDSLDEVCFVSLALALGPYDSNAQTVTANIL